MKTKIAAGIGFTVFCAGVALAAGHTGKMHSGMMPEGPKTRAEVEAKVKAHFAEMDANKDGFVTAEERTAARDAKMTGMRDAHFKAMDTNNDGSVSRSEFDAGHKGLAGGAHGGGHRMMVMKHGDGVHGGDHGPEMAGKHGGDDDVDVDVKETVTKDKDGKERRMVRVVRREGMGLARADANNDGKLSLAEALTGPLARFDRVDTDKDGTISAAERAAHREVRKERRMKWRERKG